VILLDTDHVVVLKYANSPQCVTLAANMDRSADQDFATTAVTVEEQMRGWLAVIHRSTDVHRQVPAYHQLLRLFDFFARWRLIPFDELSANEFSRLRKQRIRIGVMDLKIAATALVQEALLLSANLRDFERVPGLRVENCLQAVRS
jgi:tRNA(fMet)-specific endonuclease VapC